MTVVTGRFAVNTEGHGATVDITSHVSQEVAGSNLSSGIATVFVPGSTGGVTTM